MAAVSEKEIEEVSNMYEFIRLYLPADGKFISIYNWSKDNPPTRSDYDKIKPQITKLYHKLLKVIPVPSDNYTKIYEKYQEHFDLADKGGTGDVTKVIMNAAKNYVEASGINKDSMKLWEYWRENLNQIPNEYKDLFEGKSSYDQYYRAFHTGFNNNSLPDPGFFNDTLSKLKKLRKLNESLQNLVNNLYEAFKLYQDNLGKLREINKEIGEFKKIDDVAQRLITKITECKANPSTNCLNDVEELLKQYKKIYEQILDIIEEEEEGYATDEDDEDENENENFDVMPMPPQIATLRTRVHEMSSTIRDTFETKKSAGLINENDIQRAEDIETRVAIIFSKCDNKYDATCESNLKSILSEQERFLNYLIEKKAPEKDVQIASKIDIMDARLTEAGYHDYKELIKKSKELIDQNRAKEDDIQHFQKIINTQMTPENILINDQINPIIIKQLQITKKKLKEYETPEKHTKKTPTIVFVIGLILSSIITVATYILLYLALFTGIIFLTWLIVSFITIIIQVTRKKITPRQIPIRFVMGWLYPIAIMTGKME